MGYWRFVVSSVLFFPSLSFLRSIRISSLAFNDHDMSTATGNLKWEIHRRHRCRHVSRVSTVWDHMMRDASILQTEFVYESTNRCEARMTFTFIDRNDRRARAHTQCTHILPVGFQLIVHFLQIIHFYLAQTEMISFYWRIVMALINH